MDTIKEFKKQVKDLFVTIEANEIKKLHSILLETLNDFTEFCEKNNLTYYLTGGSALGAIRHKGFIPWDDDIDIAMPRADYNKLREKFPLYYTDKYAIEAPMTPHVGSVQFMKIRRKGTVLKGLMAMGPEYGVFIDIFPLEYAPNSKIHRIICDIGYFFHKSLSYSVAFYMLYDNVFRPHEKECNLNLKIRMRIKRLWGKFLSFKSLTKWLDEFDCMVQKKISAFYVVPSGIHKYTKECFPVDCFYPPRKAQFENLEVNIPNKVEIILQSFYGDYMKIPNISKYEISCFTEVNLGNNTTGNEND